MGVKVLTRITFIIWIAAVAVLSVMPHTNEGVLMSVKLTKSGFVMHIIAYFVGMLLCYWAYTKKDEGHRAPQLNRLRGAPLGAIQRGREGEGFRKDIFIILLAGLLIFLYSIVLEVVQFYLPYRTFNVYDVVGNGVGVLLFVIVWMLFSHPQWNRKERGPS